WTGEVSSVGSPASTGPGTIFTSPEFGSPVGTVRNTIGRVWICTIHDPQDELAQDAMKSRQSGSCSAPIVIVPACGTGLLLTVLVLPPDAPPPFLLLLPQAAASRATTDRTAMKLHRNLGVECTDPPRSCVKSRFGIVGNIRLVRAPVRSSRKDA